MPARRSKDPIKAAARQAEAQRRVGLDAACACGEKRPEALLASRTPRICYECEATQQGRSTFEPDHAAGRANSSTTLDVPINDH
ncbi:MAG: hypothetical protein WA728_02135, partial [Xanthobacteraceae bacterium]